jgi:hypothetical protein
LSKLFAFFMSLFSVLFLMRSTVCPAYFISSTPAIDTIVICAHIDHMTIFPCSYEQFEYRVHNIFNLQLKHLKESLMFF